MNNPPWERPTLKHLDRYDSGPCEDFKEDEGSFVYFVELENLIRDRIKELKTEYENCTEGHPLFHKHNWKCSCAGIGAKVNELERLLGDEQ